MNSAQPMPASAQPDGRVDSGRDGAVVLAPAPVLLRPPFHGRAVLDSPSEPGIDAVLFALVVALVVAAVIAVLGAVVLTTLAAAVVAVLVAVLAAAVPSAFASRGTSLMIWAGLDRVLFRKQEAWVRYLPTAGARV